MVAETALRPSELVLPVFVKEGLADPQPISSMPGVLQHTRESLRKAATAAAEAGVGGMIVFGIPADKDGIGSGADDPEGISQVAIADIRAEVGDDLVIMADLCLCEYTDHGHCGIVTDGGHVDNDATLERYASTAIAQARAGAHLVAPSGMMDGQVGAIRKALDGAGFADDPDLRVLGQVRLGLLRPVPRGGRGRAEVRRPRHPPAGPGQRRSRRSRRSGSTWPRAPTW